MNPDRTPANTANLNNRILLVERDSTLRDLRARILQMNGFRVHSQETIAQARSAWRPGEFDLVLINWEHHPDEAVAFCEELKSQDKNLNYVILRSAARYIPRNECSDAVIPLAEGPQHLVERVRTLLAE
jgi:DNA-binding response OmpR family regulator